MLLGAARVRAAEPERASAAEPVRVDYRADESCPDADAFERAVLLRTDRARSAREREREPARTFHVLITREGEGVHGAFSVTDAHDTEQTSSARAVDSTTCSEVFDALVLFAALSVDADASARQSSYASATLTFAPQASAPERRAQPWAASSRVSGDNHPPARRFSLVTGLAGGTLSAGTTTLAAVIEPFIETRWQRAIETGGDVSPTLRIALSTFAGESSRGEAGYAELRWTLARLDVCPLALVAARTLRLRPCLSFSGGVLNAGGREIALPASHHLPWWTLGGLLRAEWNPNAFGIELAAGLEAPLQRAQLYFEPATEVYRPPVVFERITLGLSYHFL